MKTARKAIALAILATILPVLSASAADLQTLVDQCVGGSDEARLQVIDIGLPAIPALVEVVNTQTGQPAGRAARTIGWIAEFAGKDAAGRSKAEWTFVNLLVDPDQPAAVRQVAARYLWHVASDDAVSALTQVLGNEELRTDALWSLQNIPGPAALAALAAAFEGAEGDAKLAVLATIGRRPDAPLTLLRGAATAGDAALRIVALEALGRTGSLDVATAIESRLGASDRDEKVAALQAYVAIGDAVRARGDQDAARRIYEKALQVGGDVPDVVVSALQGVGKVGTADSIAVVERFLARANSAVQVAAAGALARLPGAAATTVLASALDGATLQKARAVLSALADRADPAACGAVIPLARVDNIDVQLLALRALGSMGDPAASQVILEVYQGYKASDHLRKAAFDAYTAIGAAQLGEGEAEQARAIFESALQMARTDEQKVTALNGLADVASPKSLSAIGPFTRAEGAVGDGAIDASLACVDSMAAEGDRDGAIGALMELLEIVESGPQVHAVVSRLGALGSSIDVGSRLGYVTHWWVVGVFPSGDEYAAMDREFFPERAINLEGGGEDDGEKRIWRKHHTLDPQGMMDYAAMFRENTDAACYAYAEVTLDEAVDARLHCGSDDSIAVWINGEDVHRFKGPRGLTIDEDQKDITLKAGVNTILIKVVQGGGDWSSSVRLTDRDNDPLAFTQKTEL